MIRRLLLLVLAGLMLWLIRQLRRVRPAAPRAADAAPRFEGAMVRDRICETFLPRSRALTVRCEDGEHFFCSDGCRTAFLARTRPAAY